MKKYVLSILVCGVIAALSFMAGRWYFQPEGGPEGQVAQPVGEQVAPPPPPSAAIEVVRSVETEVLVPYGERTFDELQREVRDLCSRIEMQDYYAAYELKDDAFSHFSTLLGRAASKPPVVSGETRDLYVLLSNTTHLYRTLGREDIALVKDILSHESEQTEAMFALLYAYLNQGYASGKIRVGPGPLYEYAGFFLNALGGQSYLARLDARTAALLRYYAVLIVERAEKEGLNRHGIDIRPAVHLLIVDMNALSGLKGRDAYLERLTSIADALGGRS